MLFRFYRSNTAAFRQSYRRWSVNVWTTLCLPMVSIVAVADTPHFTDVTATSGLDLTPINDRFFNTVELPDLQVIQQTWGNGVAVGDVDGDGDLDVYLLGYFRQANKLFRNNLEQGSKTFTDVTQSPIDDPGYSRVAYFVDFDNDRDLDLLLLNDNDGMRPPSKIFRNDGQLHFVDVTEGSGFTPIASVVGGATVGDYNQDGFLDIYVSRWGIVDALTGENLLYRGVGAFKFVEVQNSAGLGSVRANGIGTFMGDLDNDVDLDLVVAMDGSADILYENVGGTFTDVSISSGVQHIGNDMGIAIGDYDNDDDLDFYQTNITDNDIPKVFGKGKYNVLYENQFNNTGSLSFIDSAETMGVQDTDWGWGTEFSDLDNDADLDLVAVSGMDDFVAFWKSTSSSVYTTPSALFVNNGSEFTRVYGAGLDDELDSRALVSFDYDRDGDQDLLITNINQPPQLLENTTSNSGNWLDVVMGPDRSAVGAKVYATTGSLMQRRDIITGRSFLTGTPSEVHFGLGASNTVDELRVMWNDGLQYRFRDVTANQLLRFHRPESPAAYQQSDQQLESTEPDTLGVSAEISRAQSFTTDSAGHLTQVILDLGRHDSTTEPLWVEVHKIKDGLPSGNALASVGILPAAIETSLSKVTIDLRAFGLNFLAGQEFAIVLKTTDPQTDAFTWRAVAEGGYENGTSFENTDAEWANTADTPETEFAFETFIDPGLTDFSMRTMPNDELEFRWTTRAGERYNILGSTTLETGVQAWQIIKPDVSPPITLPWHSEENESYFYSLETISVP